MKISGVLNTIGQTPLIKLERISDLYPFNVFAKLELFNPGGSLKDRVALNIIKRAYIEGNINDKTTVVECSSGNLGLGLAMVCKYLSLSFICVVDSKVTQQHLNLLKIYGAKIEIIYEPDPASREFLPALVSRVKTISKHIPNSFWPNQHSNINNAKAHLITMDEINTQLNGNVDYLFCATSSCGTLRGCYDYINANKLKTQIFAIDADGSKIFSKSSTKRTIPGHGAGFVPGLYTEHIKCKPIIVNATESIVGCKTLLDHEAILAGGSSGAIISSLRHVKNQVKPESNCVLILCDRGERYADSIYSDTLGAA